MITHNLIQGTPEWHQFRLEHFGASEAAAMLGLSKKVTRTELLHMKSTGNAREFSEWVQKNILDYGHEVEALARPIIEEEFGIDLYPVTCSEGLLSASCDGLTLCETDACEHKQRNKELVASVEAGIVPDDHMPQCQQIMMVTGAKRVIFVVSDGTRENMVWTEVFPDPVWFERIRAGWEQFKKDRDNYVHVVHPEKPAPEVSIQLPALYVHARGEITTSNMQEYGQALAAKLSEVRSIVLATDQDFSNAREAAKLFREQCKKLQLAKEAMLSQTVTIGEAARMMDAWHEDLRVTALKLEKDVEREDAAKKSAMIAAARKAFVAHGKALEAELGPIPLNMAMPDFAGAIKGKRNYASMQDALDTALANAKIEADAIAKDIRAKLAWYKENAKGYRLLFPDLDRVIYKPNDDFQRLVQNRIDQHKMDEAKRLEAERARLHLEAEQKSLEMIKKAQAEIENAKSNAAVQASAMSGSAAGIVAQTPQLETPKPVLVKSEPAAELPYSPALYDLAIGELQFVRKKFGRIPQLAGVMREIDLFLSVKEKTA